MNHGLAVLHPKPSSQHPPTLDEQQPPRSYPYSFLPKWVCESASSAYLGCSVVLSHIAKASTHLLSEEFPHLFDCGCGQRMRGSPRAFPSFLCIGPSLSSVCPPRTAARSLWQRRRYRSLAFLEVSTCQRTDADGEVEGDCGARQAVGGGRLGPPSMSLGPADWA